MTIELSAEYRLLDTAHASVVLESDLHPDITLSILHERILGDTQSHDLVGCVRQSLELSAGESLTIIARCQGRIIASLVNEVDCRECSRLLLHPKGGYNLLIYQSRLDGLTESPVEKTTIEPTPATASLAGMLQDLAQQRQTRGDSLPPDVRAFLPLVYEAIRENEEAYSQQVSNLFRQILEGWCLERESSNQAVLSSPQSTPERYAYAR